LTRIASIDVTSDFLSHFWEVKQRIDAFFGLSDS